MCWYPFIALFALFCAIHNPSPQCHASLFLSRLHLLQTLTANDLREQVVLRVDGGMRSGRDVLVAAALGGDEYGFGTVAMIATGESTPLHVQALLVHMHVHGLCGTGLCCVQATAVLPGLYLGFLVWHLPLCLLQGLKAESETMWSPCCVFVSRLHHGAGVPHEQLPGGRGQPAGGAASALPRRPRRPRQLLPLRRRGGAQRLLASLP